MVAIISLKLVAYGNTAKNADGSFTCQHGVGECESDSLELCAQYKLSGDIASIETGDTSLAAWPYILCMEEKDGDPTASQACYESSMNSTALPYADIQKCHDSEYDLVMNAAMTATPKHDYVPWCLVGGVILENSNLLQKAVCDAYTGVKPESCHTAVTQEFPRVDKCVPGVHKH